MYNSMRLNFLPVCLAHMLVIICASDEPFVIEVKPASVKPYVTRMVSITCKFNVRRLKIFRTVEKITVLRYSFENQQWNNFLKFDPNNEIKWPLGISQKSSSMKFGAVHHSYLKIVWPLAIKDTLGLYACFISGYNSKGSHIMASTSGKLIDAYNAWPLGDYILPMPLTGCPLRDNVVEWRRYGFPIAAATNRVPYFSLHQLLIIYETYPGLARNRPGYVGFQVCKSVPGDATKPWPRGTYCIGTFGRCPSNFTYGRMFSRYKSYSKETKFCCRKDGSADTPAVLPTYKPFYLFRLHDKCQKISKMTVKENTMVIYLRSLKEPGFNEMMYNTSDIEKTYQPMSQLNIHMCYYERVDNVLVDSSLKLE